MNKFRKYITSSVGFCFLVVACTGVTFKFFFKNHELEEIHSWLGLAMVVFAILHIYQNWNSLRKYLTEKKVMALTVPIVMAIVFLLFTEKDEPKKISPRAILREITKANVQDVANVFKKDSQLILTKMQTAGLVAQTTSETLEQIAQKNNKPSEEILKFFVE